MSIELKKKKNIKKKLSKWNKITKKNVKNFKELTKRK